ncbi:unnamed protein product [Lampetra fluviatilis]
MMIGKLRLTRQGDIWCDPLTQYNVVFATGEGHAVHRRKRSLSFNNVVLCFAGRSALDYSNYGCYCGWGGNGVALDDADRCCEAQDKCYNAISRGCNVNFIAYANSCADGEVQCDKLKLCEKMVCSCDVIAAKCLAGSAYNNALKNYRGKCQGQAHSLFIPLSIISLTCACAFLVGCADGHAHARHTRSLINLAELIKCVTGKHACDYNAYGNWCGIGGSGTPVDEIDGCCQRHDWCYDRLIANGCWPRWSPYIYTCKDTLVNCGKPPENLGIQRWDFPGP